MRYSVTLCAGGQEVNCAIALPKNSSVGDCLKKVNGHGAKSRLGNVNFVELRLGSARGDLLDASDLLEDLEVGDERLFALEETVFGAPAVSLAAAPNGTAFPFGAPASESAGFRFSALTEGSPTPTTGFRFGAATPASESETVPPETAVASVPETAVASASETAVASPSRPTRSRSTCRRSRRARASPRVWGATRCRRRAWPT